MEHRIYIVGMGPGREDMMTGEAVRALEQADVIVGYTVYLDLQPVSEQGDDFHSHEAGGGAVQDLF